MKPEVSMTHLQGLSNNPYPGRIDPIPRISTHFMYAYDFMGGIFLVGFLVRVLKEFLPHFILVTCPCFQI